MTTLSEIELAAGCGWAAKIDKGQIVRVTASTPVALVCFNSQELTERFDQARTKVYNMRIWIGAGEQLFSKLNNPMMTIIADGFAAHGRHDLQFGMSSSETTMDGTSGIAASQSLLQSGLTAPRHGCQEILAEALKPWKIDARHIPMPLNLFQHTEIDTASGAIRRLPVRPSEPVSVDLRAEMDLVVAVSACSVAEATGAVVRVSTFSANA